MKKLLTAAIASISFLFLSPSVMASDGCALTAKASQAVAAEVNGISSPDAKLFLEKASVKKVTELAMADLGDQGEKTMQYSSTYCSTGCSAGCSAGCSSGCSVGCRRW